MMKIGICIIAALSCLSSASAFVVSSSRSTAARDVANRLSSLSDETSIDEQNERRKFLTSSAAASVALLVGQAAHADTGTTVRGTQMTPFNGLAFQYRGNGFNGLQAEDIDEPSVPYLEFVERLKAGEVEFVEFLAPNGDVAYATFKGETPQAPIRIGEGYPIEQSDGWSSPAFAVRTVKNAGVPYKFTVPALQKYKKG